MSNTQSETPPISSLPTGPGVGDQALLKRRAGSSIEEFKEHYIKQHVPIALPWALANDVSYYAQLHRPLSWATPELETKYNAAGINISNWDAVAEMVFPPTITIDEFYRAKVGKAFHVGVIILDEKRFLLSGALDHMAGVEPGAIVGERAEFIVNGKPVEGVESENANRVWAEYERQREV